MLADQYHQYFVEKDTNHKPKLTHIIPCTYANPDVGLDEKTGILVVRYIPVAAAAHHPESSIQHIACKQLGLPD